MKTWLFLSRVVTGRAGIGLHAFEHHLADSPPDLGGDGAFLRMLLNANHSICLVVSNLTVSSVNHELSRSLLLDASLGCGDSFLLTRKGFGRLALPLYRPSFAGTVDMNCFRRHIFIVRVYRACPTWKISGGTEVEEGLQRNRRHDLKGWPVPVAEPIAGRARTVFE